MVDTDPNLSRALARKYETLKKTKKAYWTALNDFHLTHFRFFKQADDTMAKDYDVLKIQSPIAKDH